MSSVMKKERREEDNGKSEVVRTVTEEEVDEFFKILRRVHVAARTVVAKVDGGDDELELPSKKRKRSQSLGLKNSLDANGVRDEALDGIKRVGSQGLDLDLNCKPETDGVSLTL